MNDEAELPMLLKPGLPDRVTTGQITLIQLYVAISHKPNLRLWYILRIPASLNMLKMVLGIRCSRLSL